MSVHMVPRDPAVRWNGRCLLFGVRRVSLHNNLALLQGAHSVGLMWWMLAREVLRMRGTISREHPWEVMPDLYFYRDPEEVSFLHKGLW